MTITAKNTARKTRGTATVRGAAPVVPLFLTAVSTVQRGSSAKDQKSLEADVIDAVQSRGVRELADLKILRSIFRLADRGVSQRQIAELVGVSQPEVSRRLKRRSLTPVDVTPREIALKRAAGWVTTDQMMQELSALTYTSVAPGHDASFDGAATSTGSARALAASFQEGLLSRDEYETLRSSVRTVRKARSA